MMASYLETLRSNVGRVRDVIGASARRAGRMLESVSLVAVTKTVSAETIRLAFDLGLREFGENRVHEALAKAPDLPPDTIWHMIGRLQTNKVSEALGVFSLVHSLDRMRLAESLNRVAGESGNLCRALVQVNVAGAASQGGVGVDEVEIFIENCLKLPYLRMCGLMAIGPHSATEVEVRGAYRSVQVLLRRLARQVGPDFKVLSLGMSGDYSIAIEEGSTLVRVGTAIFGERR